MYPITRPTRTSTSEKSVASSSRPTTASRADRHTEALTVDLGLTHYDKRRRDLIAKRSVQRLEEVGYRVVVEEAVA